MRKFIDIINENNVVRPERFSQGGGPTNPSSPLDMTFVQLLDFVNTNPKNYKKVCDLITSEILVPAINLNPAKTKYTFFAGHPNGKYNSSFTIKGMFMNSDVLPGYKLEWDLNMYLTPTKYGEASQMFAVTAKNVKNSSYSIDSVHLLLKSVWWDSLTPNERHDRDMTQWKKDEEEDKPWRDAMNHLRSLTGVEGSDEGSPKPTLKPTVTLRTMLHDLIAQTKQSRLAYNSDGEITDTASPEFLSLMEANRVQLLKAIWK